MNRSIRRERWREYDNSDMATFQANRVLERDLLFGRKDVAARLAGTSSAITLTSASTTHRERTLEGLASEKERTKHIVKIEREEDFLELMNDNDEDMQFEESKHSTNGGGGGNYNNNNYSPDEIEMREDVMDLDDSGLLEELMCVKQESHKDSSRGMKAASQKPMQMENDLYEVDLNRKIVLFPMIVDLDFLGDPGDIYKPLWCKLYNACKLDALKYDASVQLIEIGETFTVCACDNGKLFSFGLNDFFQLGRNTNENEEQERSSIGLIKLSSPRLSEGRTHRFLK